jgi:hypothetical protein
MGVRWQEAGGLLERGTTASLVPPTPAWLARLERSVDAALRPHTGDVHHGFQQLYEAVRERVVELKRGGCRVDEALMAVKQEVARYTTEDRGEERGRDPTRVAALLDAVVRWCVGGYYYPTN